MQMEEQKPAPSQRNAVLLTQHLVYMAVRCVQLTEQKITFRASLLTLSGKIQRLC